MRTNIEKPHDRLRKNTYLIVNYSFILTGIRKLRAMHACHTFDYQRDAPEKWLKTGYIR